ncbi:MAG: hypothetical protein LBP59_00190 [Planctomycetaceae bacterium]|jgi:drug/metabolite transporter (DMT)-like permease|nr:hypothetical protein [Planctomycetaceae bacterium]
MVVIIISTISLVINIFLGRERKKYKKNTLMWWIMIHASIPLIIPLRIWLNAPLISIPLFILLAIAGQLIGDKIT